MARLVECVPNVSEGRDRTAIESLADAIRGVTGVTLLDVEPGAATNRTVYTFVGSPEGVSDAALRMARKVAALLDMSCHSGEHPRIGALDVCPIVPVSEVTMEECVAIARALGRRIADELQIPVYFYEHAATREERRSLANIRAGEYEGLPGKLRDPAWKPDCGPAVFNARLGATVVGAREFLVAYNVNLNTRDRQLAHEIALCIRETGRVEHDTIGNVVRGSDGKPVRTPGRLKATRAIGWYIEEYGQAQVSVNLLSFNTTPLHVVFETVREEAERLGLLVTGSELIGMVPLQVMTDTGRYYLRKQRQIVGCTGVRTDRDRHRVAALESACAVRPAEEDHRVRGAGAGASAVAAGLSPERPREDVMSLTTRIRAPRGSSLRCRGWDQEAALRLLMNNLDPEVAERPEELIVYGGAGKAARNWPSYHAIVATLERLANDETLLVQSGKPVGVFRTHEEAPRVLIANANLVPKWATWDEFRRLDALGLTMYGQMTAGSWIYIGSQGILQGTYETFAECARQHFGGDLRGRLIVTAGLGGMGGAQPLAVTMNGGVCLAIEVDPARIRRRLETGYCDEMFTDFDQAVARAEEARRAKQPLSIGLLGNAADVLPRIAASSLTPDAVTDQTSAHDVRVGYIPSGASVEDAARWRTADPEGYENAVLDSMVAHVQAMLALQQQGAVVFDYGNNIRGQVADRRGLTDAFRIPGFVPAFVRPLFCRGSGPFRWVALSGDPHDIAVTDERDPRSLSRECGVTALDRARRPAREVPGAAGPHLLARVRRARRGGRQIQLARAARARESADRHWPRSSRWRLRRVAVPGDRGDEGRIGRDR